MAHRSPRLSGRSRFCISCGDFLLYGRALARDPARMDLDFIRLIQAALFAEQIDDEDLRLLYCLVKCHPGEPMS